MLNVGWGACVCISLNFPRNEAFFFSQSKIKRVGGERRHVIKSQVWGKVKSPGSREAEGSKTSGTFCSR